MNLERLNNAAKKTSILCLIAIPFSTFYFYQGTKAQKLELLNTYKNEMNCHVQNQRGYLVDNVFQNNRTDFLAEKNDKELILRRVVNVVFDFQKPELDTIEGILQDDESIVTANGVVYKYRYSPDCEGYVRFEK